MLKTVFHESRPEGVGSLLWLEPGHVRLIPVERRIDLGRISLNAGDSRPGIHTRNPYISRRHGEFLPHEGMCLYQDSSQNGTWLNGERLEKQRPVRLHDGDVFHFGVFGHRERTIPAVYVTRWSGGVEEERFTPDGDTGAFQVGRGVGEGLRLTEEDISRVHCVFRRTMDGWAVENCSETNPIRRNGSVAAALTGLSEMDVVSIGSACAVYDGEAFTFFFPKRTGEPTEEDLPAPPEPKREPEPKSELRPEPKPKSELRPEPKPESEPEENRLEIHILRRSVKRWRAQVDLLKDIRLTVGCGEMVLILGGSGAGKTTFLNAVMGYEPAEGSILFNGADVYRDYDRMQYEIGYVPQEDLLRKNDTVFETLSNAAEMRLPRGVSEAERLARVRETLVTFGLEREQTSLVAKLSGGQRKRLSIAVEFIGQPSLFFLDEPDSGLDGIMARSLMENLRFIADSGRIVMVITHAPDRAMDLFDKVVVLAKSSLDGSGHLAFYGSCPEALDFFGAENLEGVVRKINRPDEGGEGLADAFIRQYEQRQGGQA